MFCLPWVPQAAEDTTLAPKLKPEGIVTLKVLKQRGQSNTQIAQTLGVSEGTVRYHLRRHGRPDRRQGKPRTADAFAQAIAHWLSLQQPPDADPAGPRPANLHALHDWLRQEYAYTGSYKSVLRFVRAHYPRPRLRPYRRVETPPAAACARRRGSRCSRAGWRSSGCCGRCLCCRSRSTWR